MADRGDRPKQESSDVKKLIEGDPGVRPPIGQVQDEHEQPDGPLGAVVKPDYEVDPLHADTMTAGGSTPAKQHAADKDKDKGKGKAKKPPGDPVKLRAERAELQADHALGKLKPADRGRLIELDDEIAEAEKPA